MSPFINYFLQNYKNSQFSWKSSLFDINRHKLANCNLNNNPPNQICSNLTNWIPVIVQQNWFKSDNEWIVFHTETSFDLINVSIVLIKKSWLKLFFLKTPLKDNCTLGLLIMVSRIFVKTLRELLAKKWLKISIWKYENNSNHHFYSWTYCLIIVYVYHYCD